MTYTTAAPRDVLPPCPNCVGSDEWIPNQNNGWAHEDKRDHVQLVSVSMEVTHLGLGFDLVNIYYCSHCNHVFTHDGFIIGINQLGYNLRRDYSLPILDPNFCTQLINALKFNSEWQAFMSTITENVKDEMKMSNDDFLGKIKQRVKQFSLE